MKYKSILPPLTKVAEQVAPILSEIHIGRRRSVLRLATTQREADQWAPAAVILKDLAGIYYLGVSTRYKFDSIPKAQIQKEKPTNFFQKLLLEKLSQSKQFEISGRFVVLGKVDDLKAIRDSVAAYNSIIELLDDPTLITQMAV